jgi:hypothetical protein
MLRGFAFCRFEGFATCALGCGGVRPADLLTGARRLLGRPYLLQISRADSREREFREFQEPVW